MNERQEHWENVLIPYIAQEYDNFLIFIRRAMVKYGTNLNNEDMLERIYPCAAFLAFNENSDLTQNYMHIIKSIYLNNEIASNFRNDEGSALALPIAAYIMLKYEIDFGILMDSQDFAFVIEACKDNLNCPPHLTQQDMWNDENFNQATRKLIDELKKRGNDKEIGINRFNSIIEFSVQTLREIKQTYNRLKTERKLKLEDQDVFWFTVRRLYDNLDGCKYVDFHEFMAGMEYKMNQFRDQFKSAEDAFFIFYGIFLLYKARHKYGNALTDKQTNIIMSFVMTAIY